MAAVVVAALAIGQVCPIPNTTFEAGDSVQFFCVGLASSLYDADDFIAYPRGADECPEPSPACNDNSCLSLSKYVAQVNGPLCACSYGRTSPDPDIGNGTGSIVCSGEAPEAPPGFDRQDYSTYTIAGYRSLTPLNGTRFTTDTLSAVLPHQVVLSDSACPSSQPRCASFWSEGPFFDGSIRRNWGVCQPAETGSTGLNESGFYLHAVAETRAIGQCNCRSREIRWKKIQIDTGTALEDVNTSSSRWALGYFEENKHEVEDATACKVTQLGWGWDTAIPGEPEISLMLPGGGPVDVEVVAPTGTIDPKTGLECGRYFPDPPGSITLEEYCRVRARSQAVLGHHR